MYTCQFNKKNLHALLESVNRDVVVILSSLLICGATLNN